MYTIILYYKYIKLDKPEEITSWQKGLCLKLGLKGRIIIAKEGINGTLEGTAENIEKYIKETKTLTEFSNINFKRSGSSGKSFPKLSVKHRKEIVTLGRPELFPKPGETGGKYLKAEELHNWLEEKKDIVILDMRNEYECAVGKFEGSEILPIRNFREIPSLAPQLQKIKDKTVVAVCTGGIRCEKGTAYLKKELGFDNIYQLHDGIVTYMNKYPQGHFKGSLYVFDGRVTMRPSDTREEVIGQCVYCGSKSERFINCSNDNCHKHFIACEKCTGKTTCPRSCN
jgi:UPF0176 protein